MEKVPQIVSERLRAASLAIGHPDPDVLTAFSERSLRNSERAAVIEHLARCGDCREVVALALPPSDQLQVTSRPASDGWLTWPVLRWGFIAAGVVAIASFGIARYQRHPSSTTAYYRAQPEAVSKEAENLPPAPQPAAPVEDRDKGAAGPASPPANRKVLSSSSAGSTPSAEMPPPAMGGPVQPKRALIAGTLPHGPREQWQQNTNVQQQVAQFAPKQLRGVPAQNAPPSANPETADVEGAAGTMTASLDSSAVQNKIDQQALQNGRAETRIERSKLAPTAATNAVAASAAPPASPARIQLTRQDAQAVAASGMSVLWTITATGGLQRSLDQGTSWQDIDVNGPSAAAGTGAPLMKAPARAKEVAADSLAKKDASSALVFRAVASNGPDVWAGASGGLLYHSADAGSHWTRIVPSISGVSLTGDIISLDFVDAQHGRVVTSIPEVWTTSDGGQSWQKQ